MQIVSGGDNLRELSNPIFFLFSHKTGSDIDISCKLSPVCMKSFFFLKKKSKKIISLSSAEISRRVVKIKQ